MKYRLLALDLDGTLLSAAIGHSLSDENRRAVGDAQRAGLRVVLATGRSYVETIDTWRALKLTGPYEPLVVIGGALVAEPHTGRTLAQRAIARETAFDYADALCELGYSALAIVDAWRWGIDYYVAQSRDAGRIQREWFDKMNVRVRRVKRLREAPDMPEPLRINAVLDGTGDEDVSRRMRELGEQFAGRLNVHEILAPNYGVRIFEAFAPNADKWRAVRYVAQAHRIGAGQIAAVGDDVNDLPMIRGVGLGVAMPEASQPAKEAADCIAEGGLAAFIDDLISGRYD